MGGGGMRAPQPSSMVLAQLRERIQVLEHEKSVLLRALWELAGMLPGEALTPSAIAAAAERSRARGRPEHAGT